MDGSEKLKAVREALRREGVQALLLPVGDPYMSEYPPACYRRLEWLTGFTGSAGMAAVLEDRAALFVDGRYTLQAGRQLDGRLYEAHNSADMPPGLWLKEHAPEGSVVGYDPWLHTVAAVRGLERELEGKGELRALAANPVDGLWSGRPPLPAEPVFTHPKEFSGEAPGAKRERIALALREKRADAALIAAPDSVCWLLDIRGGDVPNTPLALAMALLYADGRCGLFMEEHPLADGASAHLGEKVRICPAAALEAALKELNGKRLLLDPAHAPMACYEYAKRAGAEVAEAPDPCLLPKACKNAVEMDGIRAAHVRDGAALARFLCWLDGQAERGHGVSELDAEKKLLECRRIDPLFRGPSFYTIAGAGPHGAIVHYRATEQSNRTLERGGTLLLDSGGQYPDGTTDVTRTVAISDPGGDSGGYSGGELRDRFTRVLKGHIALAVAVFPEGTTGAQLDALARHPLWQAGLDYDHGTGHGVGHYMNVHEGPQRISKRGGGAALAPGMVISNEPGYYKEGEYGIRIENLVAVRRLENPAHEKKFLGFETLTCAPIDTRLVERSLLTETEILWLNRYHAWVEKALSPLLEEEERVWLKRACGAI